MLRTYQYLQSDHSKLHEFIVAFFNRIENETGDFDMAFFEPDFRSIVKSHRKIVKQRCRDIYEAMKTWPAGDRASFCEAIRKSNDIKGICQGIVAPMKADQIPEGVRGLVKDLFINLYEQVLDGKSFSSKYKTLKDHFDAFRKLNSDITLCPICGISQLKTQFDYSRDQYDHYLPKANYPLSAVNFENLMPICAECNSPNCKGSVDPIAASTGKLFYPYDANHKGIEIKFQILTDDIKMDNIEWGVNFACPDEKHDEIQSWRTIYKIDSRYKGFVKGRIKKWYRAYWEGTRPKDGDMRTNNQRRDDYMQVLQTDQAHGLDYLRKPSLDAYLTDSVLSQAEFEANLYS
jgi:5-methylcytosine-specific restriction endonuclease McrA